MSSDEDSESHEKNLGLSMSYTPDSDELIADVLDDEDSRNSENNDEFNAGTEMNKEAIDSISYSSNSSDDGQAAKGEDAIDVSHSSNAAANYSHDAMVGTPDVNLKVDQYEETKQEDQNIPSFDEAKEKNANISYSSSDDDDDSSSSDSDTSTSSSDDDDDDGMTISSTDVNHDGIQYNEKMTNVSKTLRQSTAPISEFDRAMASTQEAQTQKKKFVYDGSPDRQSNEKLGIDPPPPPPVSDGVSDHISPSNESLISGSEIDRVQTIDEDDNVVELTLSESRSYEKETKVDLIRVASSTDEIDPMKLIQSMSADSVDNQSRIVDSEMPDTNLASVVSSQSNSKSLAQQIKQSIDTTPSMPLPKTINPQQELPTMKMMNNVPPTTTIRTKSNDIPSNVIPDVLKQVGDKFDSLFESERRAVGWKDEDEQAQLNRENIRRTFQQLVSPAVLVSLAHKKHERRTIASIEIQTVVKDLVIAREFDRVKGVILLLTDDYIRSTNEDARKGGVIAMASCAIALRVQKKSRMSELTGKTKECME